MEGEKIINYLLSNGFTKYEGNDKDYDCILRLHDLHWLFWSNNLKHFSLGVLNEKGKKLAGGGYNKWKMVMIPKPIYTIKQVQILLKAIT